MKATRMQKSYSRLPLATGLILPEGAPLAARPAGTQLAARGSVTLDQGAS